MEELKICPFCRENKARHVYWDVITQEMKYVDTDEELDREDILAYVHCFGCDIDFWADSEITPREVVKKWNNRALI